ncbi:hypothetical protein CYMTET_22426 [Cymbomonas tetramitiformis]|uniref:EF-hand domain-containing protein n=1 Tax=Cymbomonas tetramitiformis TaxID=36881 RepID=A0AAE0G0F5_9CHLO|nr:hypothetical protein CYMTET_22426 [Cymbomonas tetramitiformis]
MSQRRVLYILLFLEVPLAIASDFGLLQVPTFSQVDLDHDGCLTSAEYAMAFRNLQKHMTQDQAVVSSLEEPLHPKRDLRTAVFLKGRGLYRRERWLAEGLNESSAAPTPVPDSSTGLPTTVPPTVATSSPLATAAPSQSSRKNTTAPVAAANSTTPTAGASESPTQGASESPTRSASESPTRSASESPTEGASESPTEGASESPTEGGSGMECRRADASALHRLDSTASKNRTCFEMLCFLYSFEMK